MSCELRFDPRVRKQFKQIDKHILRRIKDSADRLKERPRLGKLLSGTSNPTRSLQCSTPGGEFRVVYVLKKEDQIVYIFHLEKREGDYKDLHRKYDL